MIISEGDLQIDGGHYRNMIDTFSPDKETRGAAILIDGGTAVKMCIRDSQLTVLALQVL